MESPFIEYEWQIEDLEKENTELKKRVILLGDLVFKARKLAEEVMKEYPNCSKMTYDKAKEFLKS